jgi:hypothetical protein
MRAVVGQFVVVLVVAGFVAAHFWWIIGGLAVAGLVWVVAKAFREIEAQELAEAHRQAALIRRADQQHHWVLAGRAELVAVRASLALKSHDIGRCCALVCCTRTVCTCPLN